MATEVLDELGIRCLVRSDSPAAPYINALKRRGFEYIVLPRALLTGRALPANLVYEAGHRQTSLLPSTPAASSASADALLLSTRCVDCLHTLVNLEGFDAAF